MTGIHQQESAKANTIKSSGEFYDYIITGTGCAGLSLVMHIIATGQLNNKKILLVDAEEKNKNDRTWCFWEEGDGLFQPIVFKEWKQLKFKSVGFEKDLAIAPYTYKLIRGIDFYQYCFEQIQTHSNIYIKKGRVEEISSNNNDTYIKIDGELIKGSFIFNSIIFKKPVLINRHFWLLQHFKGWFIEADNEVFDPLSATIMDFSTDQKNGTSFFYVLPFSKTKALIEYTLFSPQILDDSEYEGALEDYTKNTLAISSYTVHEREMGSIPMTNYKFPKSNNNIINIGTAGGQTKGSSGYTFQFIQKHSRAVAAMLAKGKSPLLQSENARFLFYDSVLLRILHEKTLEGREIFKRLFERNKASSIFKFLDNETSLAEELPIISSLPTLPFLKAAIKQTTGI